MTPCSSCGALVQVVLVVEGRPAPFRGRTLAGAEDGTSEICLRCYRTPVAVAVVVPVGPEVKRETTGRLL